LAASLLEDAFVFEDMHYLIEQQIYCIAVHEPRAELTQDGIGHPPGEARIGQFQSQKILPIDATSDGVRSLTIREILSTLQDRNER
jgi:hypothetical protein